jgi:1-phosphofructokinase family hexose kinase
MSGPTIICASANPAMDRRLRVPRLTPGEINRAASAQGFAGGKAAHVAMAARAIAGHAVWIGFLGGPVGQECGRQMENLGIQVVAIPTRAETRVNLEIIDDSGAVTEVLEPGTAPTASERDDFWREFVLRMKEEPARSVAAISGSLPPGLEPDFYISLIQAARAAQARVFVDTSGEALQASARAVPDFLKTNRAEAEGLLKRPLKTLGEVVNGAREMIRGGAKSSAITLGREGLVWIETENGPVWVARPPHVNVISPVGSGDATLGGFACAAIQGLAGEAALRLAAACGVANLGAPAPGRIDRAAVESLIARIEVEKLDL